MAMKLEHCLLSHFMVLSHKTVVAMYSGLQVCVVY